MTSLVSAIAYAVTGATGHPTLPPLPPTLPKVEIALLPSQGYNHISSPIQLSVVKATLSGEMRCVLRQALLMCTEHRYDL